MSVALREEKICNKNSHKRPESAVKFVFRGMISKKLLYRGMFDVKPIKTPNAKTIIGLYSKKTVLV